MASNDDDDDDNNVNDDSNYDNDDDNDNDNNNNDKNKNNNNYNNNDINGFHNRILISNDLSIMFFFNSPMFWVSIYDGPQQYIIIYISHIHTPNMDPILLNSCSF